MASVKYRSTIPQADGALLAWAQNASAKISLSPTTYGLTAAIATSLASALSGYQTALAACERFSRNRTSVIAKNAAKDLLVAQCRDIVGLVDYTSTVSDEERSELGIPPRKQRTPIGPPTFAPEIDIVSVVGRTVTVRVHGTEGSRRGRPAGVAGLQLYSYAGTNPPQDPNLWRFEGASTLTVTTVEFPLSVEAGTQVWFKACWTSPRNQCGPASAAVPTYIQYGASTMAA